MHAAQTSASKLRLVTPEKESSMNTLWQQEEFLPVKRKSEGDRFRVVQERGYWGGQDLIVITLDRHEYFWVFHHLQKYKQRKQRLLLCESR